MIPDLPKDIVYLNHVSTITNHKELHLQRLEALMKVQTETFFFQDDDDPLPNKYIEAPSGLVYGDFIKLTTAYDFEDRTPAFEWASLKHLGNPCNIHRAFCNTLQAQAIAGLLPKEEHWTEIMLYYFLAKHYGATMDRSLDMFWRVKSSGMHVKASPSVMRSVSWIMSNEHKLDQLL